MTARHLRSTRLCGDDAKSHFLARYELARSCCLGPVYQTAHARPCTNEHVTKMRRARSSPFAFRAPCASRTIWRRNSVANSATSTTVLARSRGTWGVSTAGQTQIRNTEAQRTAGSAIILEEEISQTFVRSLTGKRFVASKIAPSLQRDRCLPREDAHSLYDPQSRCLHGRA